MDACFHDKNDYFVGVFKEALEMKKYEYVSVHVGKLVGAKSEEHRHIIDEYA